ncbi:hypothetical protein BAE44_0014906 [Dichanthelium oligosanthes]|uniref:KIB1-4 beta-propeller domain-containing protein n=1 Tax=Dichanthelium oligosanthes TaxID=888268 RepID=A0A1E5VG80_9POAL|nr:hypothetical protein BAE44_0014906 [Dichanthelium oligosanthes]
MEEASTAGTGGRPPLGTLPVPVYDHGLNPNVQIAFAIGNGSLHTRVVPELAENYYHVTPHAWVLLVAPGPAPRTRLWDPRFGESVSLPTMECELPENWKCYLSGAPTMPSCVMLVLHIYEPTFLYCHVGDRHWSAHEYDIGNMKLPPEYAPPRKLTIQQTAAVDGKFYFQETARLGVIDFSTATPEFSFIDYPHAEFPNGSNCHREYMVESCKELFNIYICFKGFATDEIIMVRAYHIDLSGPTLSEVDELGDRVFLLSYPNAQLLYSASKYGLKGNQVYFGHNVIGELDGGFVYIYNMEDKSLETVRPCPQMEEFLHNPFWMLPTDQVCTRE